MATQVEESPLEAREDRLRRRAKRKSAKADRLEARGKTKRAAKKRGAAKVKTAKADKIAGKQDAKDEKQAGRQAKKLAKVKGKAKKKAERKENRGKKIKKAGQDIAAAGKKVSDAAKGAKDKVKGAKDKVKKAVSKKKKQVTAAVAGAKEGYNSVAMHGPAAKWGGNKDDYHREDGHKTGDVGGGKYGKGGHFKDYEGPSMGVHDAETDYRGHAMDNMGKENKLGILDGNPPKGAGYYGSAMYGPSKYDNAHTLKNPGHHQAPSMSGKAKSFGKGPKYGGGSPISKHFGRNRSKKRQIDKVI